jgi:hypothetical protein
MGKVLYYKLAWDIYSFPAIEGRSIYQQLYIAIEGNIPATKGRSIP